MIKTTWQPVYQRAASLAAGLIILCAQAPANAAVARQADSRQSQGTATPVPLEAGKPLERELSAGETHAYALALAAGQYLHLVVDQRGIDVVVTLFAPDGKKLSEVDSPNGTSGPEPLEFIAETSGNYRLEVRSLEKNVPAGRYEARIDALRAATEKDKAHLAELAEIEKASQLAQKADVLRQEWKLDEAIPLAEQSLAIAERIFGAEHPNVAGVLNVLGLIYDQKRDEARAEQAHLRALSIRQKVLGPNDPLVGVSLNNLGLVYANMLDAKRAEQFYLRAIETYEKSPQEGIRLAQTLNNLAQLYRQQLSDTRRAEPLMERALLLREKALGSQDPLVARSLLSLSGIYTDRSDARAEQFARRALEIFEKAYGPQHPLVGDALLALAIFYGDRQDFATAEPLYQRALIINEKAYGAESPQVSALLSNFALLYKNKGDYPRAEAMAQRALSNYEKEYGQENFHFANLLSQLAVMYRDDGDFVRAEEMLQRAIAIQEKKLGPESRDVAMSLDSLAVLYRMKGEYTKAEPLLQRALTISEKASGPESNDATLIVFNLAGVLRDKGDYPRAEQLYTRSLAIAEKMYGTAHHNLGAILGSLASLYVAQGDKAQALAAQTRANDIAEHNLSAALTTGSENQKRLYLATLSSQTDMTLTLNTALAPDSIEARRLALTTILRRKGRALDAMSNQVESLRRRLDPQDRPLLDQLSATRAQLSALTLKGANRISQAQYRAEVARLEAEAERLEAQVGARSAEFRVETEPVTLAGVQAALPAGAALVEIVSYRPYNPAGKTFKDRFGAPRYVAYVLKPQGEPSFVDLGEAASIDREVSQLRVALSSPGSKDVKQLARALDERVMRPVRALLGGVRHVLISPDGALNLLPFGALVDEQNRYLIETYLISYLTSGRDLLRLRAARESRETPLVIANPLFNDVSAESGVSSSSRGAENLRAPDFSEMKFISLPGTGGEARALATILPGARVLTGGQATEAALKQARGPSVLHIATHGFFMPDLAATPGEARRGLPGDVASPDAERVVAAANAPGESLLLRSGLILAGANNLHSVGGEDGVLTALEASGLDLWGTKLVVLSACNTGVGSVRNSDGVYGLRRALVLAGSESQVMSLWQVSDTATRDLMTAYYGRLAAGGGRAEALREVQLGMLRSRLLSHPFFWSSFIQSGEWKAMSLPKAGAQ